MEFWQKTAVYFREAHYANDCFFVSVLMLIFGVAKIKYII